MSQRPTCIECGASAPDTNTNYTLISTSFGWRLTRRVLPDGAVNVEWRCTTCWRKQKARPAASVVAPASSGFKGAVRQRQEPKGRSSSSPPGTR